MNVAALFSKLTPSPIDGRIVVAVLALLNGLVPSQAVSAPIPPTKLRHDYIGMAELTVSADKSRLAVFQSDAGRPIRQRWLFWFEKLGRKLASAGNREIDAEVVAYDVCHLDGNGSDRLLFVKVDGVDDGMSGTPLVRTPTLFPHARDDALPRVRLCFDLFPGESPALVVPTIRGVTIHRQIKGAVKGKGTQPVKGDTKDRYELHAEINTQANARFQGQPLRGDDAESKQRVILRLEFPDLTPTDVNGDGLVDLCFNQGDRVSCHLQDIKSGFAGARVQQHYFEGLAAGEDKDSSIRLDSRVVDLNNDGRVDVVLQKTNWNVGDMQTTLSIFLQSQDGSYSSRAVQTIKRSGYFAYQEFIDVDSDGHLDIVAPVASLGWSKLVGIFLSKSADIDFVWYRNQGGRFLEEAKQLHAISWPVDLKNMQAILSSLPVWNVSMRGLDNAAAWQRYVMFFPAKKSLQMYGVDHKGALSPQPLWRQEASVGNEVLLTDLDRDGRQEVAFAYPRDVQRSKTLLYIDPP